MKEIELQRSILDYLAVMENQGKCFCFRSGAGAVKLDNGRYFKTGRKGVQDITCCVNGTYVAFEVKKPVGKLSEAQEEVKKATIANGGRYFVIRSIDEVMDIIH